MLKPCGISRWLEEGHPHWEAWLEDFVRARAVQLPEHLPIEEILLKAGKVTEWDPQVGIGVDFGAEKWWGWMRWGKLPGLSIQIDTLCKQPPEFSELSGIVRHGGGNDGGNFEGVTGDPFFVYVLGKKAALAIAHQRKINDPSQGYDPQEISRARKVLKAVIPDMPECIELTSWRFGAYHPFYLAYDRLIQQKAAGEFLEFLKYLGVTEREWFGER